jgi:IS5 family transposase
VAGYFRNQWPDDPGIRNLKTRYRGLAKNRAQLFTLFALGNLFLVRRKLMA